MKNITLICFSLIFAICVNAQMANAQQVEWAKEIYNDDITKGHFFNNEFYLIGVTQNDTVKIDSTIYSWNTNTESWIASFKKDGTVDTVLRSPYFIPGDFIKEINGFYFSGWGPFYFCIAKSELNGNTSWSECYTSTPLYGLHNTYYPSDMATSLIEHKNSLYAVGHYQDSLQLGNQWMYGSNSLLTK